MPTLFGQRQIQIQASREAWQSRPRPDPAKEKEYAFSSLPAGVQVALALRWWAAKVEDGKGVMQKARDGDLRLRWDAFLRLPKSQQAVGRKHMSLLELEHNGASRNQAIATLQSQGAGHNRMTFLDGLKA